MLDVLNALRGHGPHHNKPKRPKHPIHNIIDAMRAPDAWGRYFVPEHSWRSWETVLRAFFGLPPEQGDLALYQRHTGRSEWPTEPCTELWLVCGRRAGKSRIVAAIAAYLAAWRDYSRYLAPGEWATIPVIAADRKEARTIMGYIAAFLDRPAVPVSVVAPDQIKPTTEMLFLSNRTVIEIHTSSFRSVRGYTLVAAICDEIAFWRTDDSSRNPDREILRAIRPGLATIPGAPLLCLSSPYAKRGELWGAFRDFFGQHGPILVWQAATRDMNPSIPEELVATALRRDPEAARSEWLGEFREDVASFVPLEVIDACTDVGVYQREPQRGVHYQATCDPSGGVNDSMTLCIYHVTDKYEVITDLLLEARAPFSPTEVVRTFAEALRRYNVSVVLGDRFGGEWPADRFREFGISYRVAEENKSRAYMHLLAALMDRRIRLLDNERLRAELSDLERRTRSGGADLIDHPPGGHDDLANVVALAAYATRPPTMGVLLLGNDEPRLKASRDIDQVRERLASALPQRDPSLEGMVCSGCAHFIQHQSRCGLRGFVTPPTAPACEVFSGAGA